MNLTTVQRYLQAFFSFRPRASVKSKLRAVQVTAHSCSNDGGPGDVFVFTLSQIVTQVQPLRVATGIFSRRRSSSSPGSSPKERKPRW